MTIGSPLASSSGPGSLETNANRFPSGDHATRSPIDGSTWFVPVTGAMNRMPRPSARATATPLLSPTRPKNASHCPSGDHRGAEARVASVPRRVSRPVFRSLIHASDDGRPAPSRRVTAYANRWPSGDSCTSPNERTLYTSALVNPAVGCWLATGAVTHVTTDPANRPAEII